MDHKLIAVLSDGDFHSGEDLGRLLGVSRAAVWKQLQKLSALDIPVESVRGRGYRIPGGLELLVREAVAEGLSPEVNALLADLVIRGSVDSTNGLVAALGPQGHGVVCLAEHQTQGRGRRGRSWSSPFGRNLYLSVGWQFEGGASSLEGLSLAVGLAVRRALGSGEELKLKWPNDLLYQGRKLAGILLEMNGDPSGQCQVVVGVGINTGMAGSQRPDVDQPWADVGELVSVGRNRLAAQVINELLPMLATYARCGFAAYRDEWNGCDAFRDQEVRLMTPARAIAGVARGVAENGAIRIEIDGDTHLFNGGEVSLRLLS